MINRFLVIFLGLVVSLAVALMHPDSAEAQVIMDGLAGALKIAVEPAEKLAATWGSAKALE